MKKKKPLERKKFKAKDAISNISVVDNSLKEPMTEPMDITMEKPFGPFLMQAMLPPSILKKMLKITNDITKSSEKQNWGHALAGQVTDEPVIPNELLKEEGLYDFFNMLGKHYVDQSCEIHGVELKMNQPRVLTDITSMWIVNQKQNEYNPVHHHTNATLSSEFYLKIPKYKKRAIPYKKDQDGSIEFIYSADQEEHVGFSKGCYMTSPIVGQLFMFPSYLLHTVYPFLGRGERRSVSMNIIHQIVDNDEYEQSIKRQIDEKEDKTQKELEEIKKQLKVLSSKVK